MNVIEVFGNNLKKYRTAMGMSKEAFAEKCGLHRTYISAIEWHNQHSASNDQNARNQSFRSLYQSF